MRTLFIFSFLLLCAPFISEFLHVITMLFISVFAYIFSFKLLFSLLLQMCSLSHPEFQIKVLHSEGSEYEMNKFR
jgi:hypothetical protein